MLGDSLLVANVVEKGASIRTVYLPDEEVFYDFYTREKYKGGRVIEIPVELGSIPLFIRDGGIIPFASSQLHNLMTQKEQGLYIICAAGRDGTFMLYEDDGYSMEYENGNYLKTQIIMTAGEITVLEFLREGRYVTTINTIQLDIIHREKAPFWVSVDNKMLKHYLHRKKFDESSSGWYYSQTLKSVQMKYPNLSKNYRVVISSEQFDMIGM